MSETILINRLPSRTWNRLGVNEVRLPWDTENETALPAENFRAGQGECPAPFFAEAADAGCCTRREFTVEAEAHSRVTVYEFCTAHNPLAVRMTLKLGEGASLRLVQLLTPASVSLLRHETAAECAQGASLETVTLLLGDGDVYADEQIALRGDRSRLHADFGYLAQSAHTIDINLNVEHWGKATESEITASGALLDAAKKTFRGTIDFKNGSADSVGSENETVLLLGEDVVNKTVPVILCAEENVEGSHGATIGELDEETRFYFGSRGIPPEAAEKILARAAVERLARASGSEVFSRRAVKILNEQLHETGDGD